MTVSEAMPKFKLRRRKFIRRKQIAEKAWNDNKRRLLAKRKPNVCEQQLTNPEPTGSEDSSMYSSSSSHLEPIPVWHISLLSLKNILNPVKTTISSMCCWWLSSINQGFEAVKHTLFPSLVYLREVNALRQRIEAFEKELLRLQGILEEFNNAKAVEMNCCRKCSDCSPGPVKIPIWPVQPIISQNVQLEPFPPPPPPPPPPLPPSVSLKKPLQIRKIGSEKQLRTIAEEEGRPLSVSLKDLLKVKLRKTENKLEVVSDLNRAPLVTVKDLLKVRLRKTESKSSITKMETPGRKRSPLVTISDLQNCSLRANSNIWLNSGKIIMTPNKFSLDLRRHLKKVAIQRSPGGTPLYSKENQETGKGLTPVMTQALRRKFEMARPKTPSPHGSADTSFDEQNAY